MEFRLWSEPLSQSIFENHLRAPKAYNGNTSSSHYDNLVLRIPLDNNLLYNSFESIFTIFVSIKLESDGIGSTNYISDN